MRAIIIAGASVLAACTMAVSGGESASSAQGCQAEAVRTWDVADGGAYIINASSAGPDCQHAVATIVVRDGQNDVLWADALAVQHTFGLNEASTPAAMRTALEEWIGANTTIMTASELPQWLANTSEPQSGEFPFYPEPEWNDRAAYEEVRARNAPMFCYVQGMESMACLALEHGRLTKIGVQSFPG